LLYGECSAILLILYDWDDPNISSSGCSSFSAPYSVNIYDFPSKFLSSLVDGKGFSYFSYFWEGPSANPDWFSEKVSYSILVFFSIERLIIFEGF